MALKPENPLALVTGGAVRLGREICLGLAATGYDIALHYNRSQDAAEKTAGEIQKTGKSCEIYKLDLSAPFDPDRFFETIGSRQRLPSLLVNSASVYGQAEISQTNGSLFDEQIAVNIKAPFFLSSAFFRKAPAAAQIINILDNKIHFEQYEYAAYLLSKKMLAEFTKMAALEFAPSVRVNAVAPGVTMPASERSADYIQWRLNGIPLKRQGKSENILQAIRFFIENEFVTGQILTVDGGEGIQNTGRNAASYSGDTNA